MVWLWAANYWRWRAERGRVCGHARSKTCPFYSASIIVERQVFRLGSTHCETARASKINDLRDP